VFFFFITATARPITHSNINNVYHDIHRSYMSLVSTFFLNIKVEMIVRNVTFINASSFFSLIAISNQGTMDFEDISIVNAKTIDSRETMRLYQATRMKFTNFLIDNLILEESKTFPNFGFYSPKEGTVEFDGLVMK
jgi:hypothetical protein